MRQGRAFDLHALSASQLADLQVDTRQINWTAQHNDEDPWIHYLDAKIRQRDHFPAINALRYQLEASIWALGEKWPQLYNYRANDVTAQYYRDQHDGIGAHQDYSVDRLLIAIFTIYGRGELQIMSARRGGEIIDRFDTEAGSLALLWAPDLTPDHIDRRPAHRIRGRKGGRISITYRYSIDEAKFKNEVRGE